MTILNQACLIDCSKSSSRFLGPLLFLLYIDLPVRALIFPSSYINKVILGVDHLTSEGGGGWGWVILKKISCKHTCTRKKFCAHNHCPKKFPARHYLMGRHMQLQIKISYTHNKCPEKKLIAHERV